MPTNDMFVTVNLHINKTSPAGPTGSVGTDARDPGWEADISKLIQGEQSKIREDILRQVTRTLGEERNVRVEGLYVGRGSVTVLALLAITYAGVRDYKTVRDSLDKIILDIRQILTNFLQNHGRDARVDNAWGETLVPEPRTRLVELFESIFEGISLPLVFYLVLSNIILIGFLLWVVLPLDTGGERWPLGTKLFEATHFWEMISLLLVLYMFGLVLINIVLMVLFAWTAFKNRR